MLLAIDIGNTNIVTGVFEPGGKGAPVHSCRLSTIRERTGDEYGIMLSGFLSSAGIKASKIKGSIISSVVPSLNKTFKEAVSSRLGIKKNLLVGEDLKVGIPVLVDNPGEVGSDRLVNAVAAYSIYKTALIIVDFGTAITFDCITGSGEYAGGAIAPGMTIAANSLFERTAKLPMVEVLRPEKVIGRNTVECMQSGIFYGFTGLVDGIIERMLREIKGRPRVIATGGYCGLISAESRYITATDEFLTLKGLKILYEGK